MQNGVLFGIMMTLLNKKRVSSLELSLKYEMSTRTIRRYIDALGEAGIPIVSIAGRNGGFEIMESFKLQAACFTAEEYERLLESVRSFSNDELSEKITEKLSCLSKSVVNNFFLATDKLVVVNSNSKSFENKLNTVKEALKDNFLLEIDYHAKEGDVGKRTVEPLCLYLNDGQWYVYAFCRLRKDFRYFKIARIASLTRLDEKFNPRPFDKSLSDFNQRFVPRVDVTVTFRKQVLAEMEEWLGVENIYKTGDGYCGFGNFPYDKALLSKIMSFGEKIKVLRPAKLVSEIRQTANNIISIHTL